MQPPLWILCDQLVALFLEIFECLINWTVFYKRAYDKVGNIFSDNDRSLIKVKT